MVEAQVKGLADLAGELEQGDPFRYGRDAVRVTPDISLAVALDHFKEKNPLAGLRLPPVHRDFATGICCSPHDPMGIRDTISVFFVRGISWQVVGWGVFLLSIGIPFPRENRIAIDPDQVFDRDRSCDCISALRYGRGGVTSALILSS